MEYSTLLAAILLATQAPAHPGFQDARKNTYLDGKVHEYSIPLDPQRNTFLTALPEVDIIAFERFHEKDNWRCMDMYADDTTTPQIVDYGYRFCLPKNPIKRFFSLIPLSRLRSQLEKKVSTMQPLNKERILRASVEELAKPRSLIRIEQLPITADLCNEYLAALSRLEKK